MPMRYGRVDTQTALQCPPEGNLPGAAAPFPNGEPDAATHLRNVFYRMVRHHTHNGRVPIGVSMLRMVAVYIPLCHCVSVVWSLKVSGRWAWMARPQGFDDQEIVALSGAHTIGRAFKERSGTVENGYGEAGATKFTCPMATVRADGKPGVGMAGGKSWTSNWLTFDNSYFQKQCVQRPFLPTSFSSFPSFHDGPCGIAPCFATHALTAKLCWSRLLAPGDITASC
jgi:L-ascorbate peroxidase